jgi:parallel beta-helix repeat protein
VNFGLNTFGPSVANISNVEITNGSVTNCHDGIFVYHTVGSKFRPMDLSGNLSDADCCAARGLELLESHDNHIVNNEMMRNGQGLAFFQSNNNKVTGNTYHLSQMLSAESVSEMVFGENALLGRFMIV